MKKIIAAALLSALVATPALADNTSSKAAPKKSVSTQAPMMQGTKDGCDVEHNMGSHYGHGMTGGYGAGMMGGYGSGMMMEPDMHLLGTLSLSDEQQVKINKLSDELRHNNWATQGLFNDETAKLRDLYEADQRDPAAIDKGYQKIFDLKRQMIGAYLNTENSIEEVLTPEQRTQLKEERRKMHHMYGHPMQ